MGMDGAGWGWMIMEVEDGAGGMDGDERGGPDISHAN